MLKDTYFTLLLKYTGNEQLVAQCWAELEKNYSGKNRYYHALQHLENMLLQLMKVKDRISNWDAVLFSLFYHDVVYNTLKNDNEERSALLAEKVMRQLGAKETMVAESIYLILATKMHELSSNADTNYFTDADLAVLGQEWLVYATYYKNVRKEYAVYPAMIYNPGRKKVLRHFLTMERIFKTDFFHAKFEAKAKYNLQKELDLL